MFRFLQNHFHAMLTIQSAHTLWDPTMYVHTECTSLWLTCPEDGYVKTETCNQETKVPYILESNPHPFYSFRGLKNQMRIRIAVVSWILEK